MEVQEGNPQQEVIAPDQPHNAKEQIMTTATSIHPNGIFFTNDFEQMEMISFCSLSQAREKEAAPRVAMKLDADSKNAGLTLGEVTEKELELHVMEQLTELVSLTAMLYHSQLSGQPSLRDYAVVHFPELVEKHIIIMDHAYRMMGMDPLKGEALPILFGNPMFSYEEDGHVCGSALWDFMEQVFYRVTEQAGFSVSHHEGNEIHQSWVAKEEAKRKSMKPESKAAKRKAASKARKASRKK